MVAVKSEHRRTYAGQTGDERAAQRKSALVDAAFELVAERGWRALSIEAVCRRAVLNKRYFYETFTGLEAIIAALINDLADNAIALTLAAIDPGMPPEEATRRAISTFVTHLTNDPRRAKVLFGAVPAGDAAAGHRAAAIRQLIATVAAQGRSIHNLADHPTVKLTAAMLIGGTSQAVLDWLDGQFDTTREQLIEDLTALWQSIGDIAVATVRRRIER
jgi:AcrR family transcriptional regulator